jgi:cytochrome c peroxidase
MLGRPGLIVALAAVAAATSISAQSMRGTRIGDERAVPVHLQDDREFEVGMPALLAHGKRVFEAAWTTEDGGGRPFTKGSGRDLSDRSQSLVGARAFNRLSGPDANACSGCHNAPYGIPGGGGDITTLVFVQGQRFDFLTLDPADRLPTRGTRDERGDPVTLQSFANGRATPGLFGAGYIEMLARQMTADLQTVRDSLQLGESKPLMSKGVAFGVLTRRRDGTWDTSRVDGLSRLSLLAPTSLDPPTLIVRPWHQAANVVSLREFTSTSFNQHHGIQSTERFGRDTDPDGDGVRNELTRADVTAVTMFQATLAVPGRVIPTDPEFEQAIWRGESLFETVGCARCHVPRLPLDRQGWIYTEPGPYNPATNLREGEARKLQLDLNARVLPLPRLSPDRAAPSVTWVPAYTDMKLHDITDDDRPMDHEPVDMNHGTWGAGFAKGNRKFLTRRLWGVANEPPYFHHGLYTTLREAVQAHGGEAAPERTRFRSLPSADQDALVEFLKSLQVLPPNTPSLVVDEHHRPRTWPPRPPAASTSY